MLINLNELYRQLGDNTGVSFTHDELPGVVITVGFTLKENYDRISTTHKAAPSATQLGESGGDAAPAGGYRKDLH